MKGVLMTIFVGFFSLQGFAQSIDEKIVVFGIGDSLIETIKFDAEGNYLVELRDSNGISTFIQNGDTLPLVDFYSGSSVSKYRLVSNRSLTTYTTKSPKVFGAYSGEDLANHRYPISPNSVHAAFPILSDNQIAIYYNDSCIQLIDTFSNSKMTINDKRIGQLAAKKNYFDSDDWMCISNNGNYLMGIENNGSYLLYNNTTFLQSSKKKFYSLRINNNNQYTYASGRKPHKDEPYSYSYMFFIHANDSVFGPVRTTWNNYLLENGGYYYSGDDAGPRYILINDSLYRNTSADNLVLLDSKNYMFTHTIKRKKYVHANGLSYRHKFDKIIRPTMDKEGNFSCYGQQDYYIYKFVNGEKEKKAIIGYDVRPTPIYISPTGESIHFFNTDDSVYIYKDDSLLFTPLSPDETLIIKDVEGMLPIRGYDRDKPNIGQSLIYMQVDSIGYMIYNGQLSPPMMPAKKASWKNDKEVGEIIAGEIGEFGFYFIQKTGEKEWKVNVNNETFIELNGPKRLFHRNCFFTEDSLTFYGLRNHSIYQYKIQY
jgi:hypothetical protein